MLGIGIGNSVCLMNGQQDYKALFVNTLKTYGAKMFWDFSKSVSGGVLYDTISSVPMVITGAATYNGGLNFDGIDDTAIVDSSYFTQPPESAGLILIFKATYSGYNWPDFMSLGRAFDGNRVIGMRGNGDSTLQMQYWAKSGDIDMYDSALGAYDTPMIAGVLFDGIGNIYGYNTQIGLNPPIGGQTLPLQDPSALSIDLNVFSDVCKGIAYGAIYYDNTVTQMADLLTTQLSTGAFKELTKKAFPQAGLI